MRKPIFAVSLLAGLGLAVAAVAQLAPPVSMLPTVNPTADLVKIIPSGVPGSQGQYVNPAKLSAQGGYYKSVPATGFRLTLANDVREVNFVPAGTLASGYVTMPPGPSDGATACIFSTQIITLLYPTANTGQTVANAVTTLGANARTCYLYSASNTTWDRSM